MPSLRWGFILFQCIWLNAVVPGHTRGKFAMPGSQPVGRMAEAKSHGCCSVPHENPAEEKSEPPLDRDRCAVCHYAIGLTLPPVFSFDHRPAGAVRMVAEPVLVVPFVADVPRTTTERGPPVA